VAWLSFYGITRHAILALFPMPSRRERKLTILFKRCPSKKILFILIHKHLAKLEVKIIIRQFILTRNFRMLTFFFTLRFLGFDGLGMMAKPWDWSGDDLAIKTFSTYSGDDFFSFLGSLL
jgi:hypothetical protein